MMESRHLDLVLRSPEMSQPMPKNKVYLSIFYF